MGAHAKSTGSGGSKLRWKIKGPDGSKTADLYFYDSSTRQESIIGIYRGKLKQAECKKMEAGTKFEHIAYLFYLEDLEGDDGEVVLHARRDHSLTRQFIRRLVNADFDGELAIGAYTMSGKGETAGKTYDMISLELLKKGQALGDGVKLPALKVDEMPQSVWTEHPRGDYYDTTEQDNFLEEALKSTLREVFMIDIDYVDQSISSDENKTTKSGTTSVVVENDAEAGARLLDHSYDQLPDKHKVLLRRLSATSSEDFQAKQSSIRKTFEVAGVLPERINLWFNNYQNDLPF